MRKTFITTASMLLDLTDENETFYIYWDIDGENHRLSYKCGELSGESQWADIKSPVSVEIPAFKEFRIVIADKHWIGIFPINMPFILSTLPCSLQTEEKSDE